MISDEYLGRLCKLLDCLWTNILHRQSRVTPPVHAFRIPPSPEPGGPSAACGVPAHPAIRQAEEHHRPLRVPGRDLVQPLLQPCFRGRLQGPAPDLRPPQRTRQAGVRRRQPGHPSPHVRRLARRWKNINEDCLPSRNRSLQVLGVEHRCTRHAVRHGCAIVVHAVAVRHGDIRVRQCAGCQAQNKPRRQRQPQWPWSSICGMP